MNAIGPALLAAEAARIGCKLVHVSTDYVFDGTADRPYPVDAPTGPTSAYGRTKLAGEQAVRELAPELGYRGAHRLGVRRGRQQLRQDHGPAGRRPTRRCRWSTTSAARRPGRPTWRAGIVALVRSGQPAGIYHCTNSGDTTWYGFTRAIFDELGADPDRVQPTTTDKFPRPAPRPAYSVLSDAEWRAAGLPAMPDWRSALHQAFAESAAAFGAKCR